MHLHCRNIRAQELRAVMEAAFMPAIREDLGAPPSLPTHTH